MEAITKNIVIDFDSTFTQVEALNIIKQSPREKEKTSSDQGHH